MMSEQATTFHKTLRQKYDRIAKTGMIGDLRTHGWNRFETLGLPSPTIEEYRYVRLRGLMENPFEAHVKREISKDSILPHIYQECIGSHLVFIDGYFHPELSNLTSKRLEALPLNDALHTYSSFIQNQWSKSIKEETDPFAALNAALHGSALFLYLPPKTIVEQPLQIIHVITDKEAPVIATPRIQIFVGSQSQLQVISSAVALGSHASWCNSLVEIVLENNSILHYTQENEGSKTWHFNALRATLKQNSSLKSVSVCVDPAMTRSDYRVSLQGPNAEAVLNGICALRDSQESHTLVFMDHQAPSCKSMQLFKGALSGRSRTSFEGKIFVRQAAQKTEAFQLNNSLLLEEGTQANSKPNLEIFADDVKASHGATVGQLDEESIFYLKTRGISEPKAKGLLIRAFCDEVLSFFPLESLRNKWDARILRTIQ